MPATRIGCGHTAFGFKKFSHDVEANSEKNARFNVELYVERMEFKLNYLDSQK